MRGACGDQGTRPPSSFPVATMLSLVISFLQSVTVAPTFVNSVHACSREFASTFNAIRPLLYHSINFFGVLVFLPMSISPISPVA